MKRFTVWTIVAAAMMLVAGATQSFAQSTFNIPYKFKVGNASFHKGEYSIKQKDDSHLTLKEISTGKETEVAFSKRLPQPKPPLAEPKIVVDVVGNFAPSYTEYVTDYVLSEVWLPGAEGYVLHEMKGAHETKTIKGQK